MPSLDSERFERAAYDLRDTMDRFMTDDSFADSVNHFRATVEEFNEGINRLARIAGMQAENEICRVENRHPIYTETHFKACLNS